MPKIDPLLEDSGYIYQSLLEDLTAFEGLWNFPDSVDKFRAMEVTKIRAARGIQELVEAIERGALQGFGLDKSTGLLTDTPISHHYPRIAQYQAIYSPVVNLSEEVECFHKACFEMGLSSILLPKWPASLASFSHQNFPNLTLHNFLNLPTFQSSLDYPSQQNAVPNPSNVTHPPHQGFTTQASTGWGNAGPQNYVIQPPASFGTQPAGGFGAQAGATFTGVNPQNVTTPFSTPGSGAAIFNELVNRVRQILNSPEFKAKRHARKNKAENRVADCAAHLSSLFKTKNKTYRVLSMDFGYFPEHRDSISLSQIRKDTAKFLAHRKIAEQRLGYIRKMHFGTVRRHYFHAKLFFEPSKAFTLQLAEIGKVWADVTHGKGVCHDCSLSECGLKRFSRDFEPSNNADWAQLNQGVEYLCRSERLYRVEDYSKVLKTIVTA